MKEWKMVIVFVAFMMVLLGNTTTQAQSGLAQIQITNIDYGAYPQVNVHLRALDESGAPVTGLSTGSFELVEDGTSQTASVSSVENGSLYVHFIIDAGPAMVTGDRWLKAQNAILSFVNDETRMLEGDVVEISVFEGTGARQILPATGIRTSISQIVSNYRPPASSDTSYRAPLDFIESWVDALPVNPFVEGRPTVIVLLTANFGLYNTAQIEAVAEKARGSAAPIYALLVRDQENGESTAVSSLANQSGGEYFHLKSDTQIALAYNSLTKYREEYVLSYDSLGSLSGTRRVQVVSGDAQGVGSYEIQLQPPSVIITAPNDGAQIARVSDVFVEDLNLIEPTEQTVIATVDFPDGYPRRLTGAKLLVDGVEVAQATGSRELRFVWDLREGQKTGSTTYQLVVAVEDVLGLTSGAEVQTTVLVDPREDFQGLTEEEIAAQIKVAADAAAQQATDAAGAEIATLVGVIEDLVIPCTLSESAGLTWACSIERFVRGNLFGIFGVGIAIGSVVYVSKSKSGVAQNIRQTARHVVDRVTNRYRKQAVRAYLIVEEGDPAQAGQSLEVYGDTPIGRSLEVAQLLFHQSQPNTPISRLHCTLLDKEAHFEIQDEDSANGTFVNGKRLRALEPYALQDGDLIELAQVARGGVRLKFQSAFEGDWGGMTQGGGDIRGTTRTRPNEDPFELKN